MNTRSIALTAALLVGAVSTAHAADITITGKVLPGTCTVADLPVTLAEIDAADLADGHDNNLTPAVLNFTGCVGVASIDLTFDGTDDAALDGHWKNQATTGGASGVAVALLDGTTGSVYFKKGGKKTIAVAGGAATAKLDMRAGYFRKAATPITAGTVSSQITVTAVYR